MNYYKVFYRDKNKKSSNGWYKGNANNVSEIKDKVLDDLCKWGCYSMEVYRIVLETKEV